MSEDTMQDSEVAFPKHFIQEVRPIRDWEEWLELGRSAVTLDQKLGLLHGAFDVEMGYRKSEPGTYMHEQYVYTDRLQTFFEIADGWVDHTLLRREGVSSWDEQKFMVGYDKNWNRVVRTESEQRQVLARKAFDMLATHFFDYGHKDRVNDEVVWLNGVVFGPLFPVVQNFFRVDKNARENAKIRNLSYSSRESEKSRQEKRAINFLLELGKFLWSWKKPNIYRWDNESTDTKATHDREEEEALTMQAIVDSAKPWMVEVLAHLGELRLLEEWILDMDEASLAALKEIALRNVLSCYRDPVSKGRMVATIDEACYLGSQAGWLLKRHELAVSEHSRLNNILDLERVAEESARKIASLTTV